MVAGMSKGWRQKCRILHDQHDLRRRLQLLRPLPDSSTATNKFGKPIWLPRIIVPPDPQSTSAIRAIGGNSTRFGKQLAARTVKLGPPPANACDTDPRQIIAATLTYLVNQQLRMKYPGYRRQGLPVTSNHIESAVNQINQRVKGSEKL